MFVADSDLVELAQTPQPHVEDGLGLQFGKLEAFHQRRLGVVLVADDLDHRVEIGVDHQIAAEDFQPPRDLLQTVLGAAHQNFVAVVEESLQDLAQVHDPRRALTVQNIHVERDAALQLGIAEQGLHEVFGRHVAALGFQHQPQIFGRFVVDISQHGQFFGIHELRHFLHQPRLGHLIGNLADDDAELALGELLHLPCGAQAEPAAARGVSLEDTVAGLHNLAAGGKIGPRHQPHQFRRRGLGKLDEVQQRGADFSHVVGRDAGGHAHGNARRAVGEKVGKTGGQHHRLLLLAVIGVAEIHRVLIEPVQQQGRHPGQPRLGIAHGSRVIAVDIAKIAMALH